MRLPTLLLAFTLGCGLAGPIDLPAAAPLFSQPPASLDWDAAFSISGQTRPLHFVGHYQDARGLHRLEEWRLGNQHLRRRTDDRIDLHADATGTARPGQPADYVWQVIDLEKKIDHRITSQAMLQGGLPYNFWSMAHVLARPAGRFKLTRLTSEPSLRLDSTSCDWYQIAPAGQPATRACWSPAIAAPMKIMTESRDAAGRSNWSVVFTIDRIDQTPIPASAFRINLAGLRVQDVDQITTED